MRKKGRNSLISRGIVICPCPWWFTTVEDISVTKKSQGGRASQRGSMAVGPFGREDHHTTQKDYHCPCQQRGPWGPEATSQVSGGAGVTKTRSQCNSLLWNPNSEHELYLLPSAQCWMSDLTSLSLSFFFCRLELRPVLPLGVTASIKWVNTHKAHTGRKSFLFTYTEL